MRKPRQMTDSPQYIETFDDMKAWMKWRTTFIESTKTLWEEEFVLGVFEDRIVTQIHGHVAITSSDTVTTSSNSRTNQMANFGWSAVAGSWRMFRHGWRENMVEKFHS